MKKEYILDFVLTLVLCIVFIVTKNVTFIIITIGYNAFKLLKTKDLRKYMILFAFIYFVGLFFYLFYNPLFGRSTHIVGWTFECFKNYISRDCNFVPFKTITFYFQQLFHYVEVPSVSNIALNIVGNFICLIPLSIFIPYFFKKLRSYGKFFLTIMVIVFSIEIIQLITMVGSFDIDDIILNSSGCLIFYFIFKKEIINLFDNHVIASDKKSWVVFGIKVLFLLICLISLVTFFIVRLKAEKEYWDDYYNFDIKLVGENINYDDSYHTFVYEDELYKYYMNYQNIEDIEIDINGNIFLLKDYLAKETKYYISINRLESAGIILYKEAKYEIVDICPMDGSSLATYLIDDRTILELVHTHDESNAEKHCLLYYMVPHKEGETTIRFDFEKYSSEYKFMVDENNVVTYELVNDNIYDQTFNTN